MARRLSLLVLFVVLVVSAFPACYYVHGCIETERIALLSIKEGIQQCDDQSLPSTWTSQDCCEWQGVSCNHESGHVIKLHLRPCPHNRHFVYYKDIPSVSKLNSSLIQLHHLQHLDLSMNNFDGSPIPDFIGSLANLEYLNLSNARFSGVIPHEALGNLSRLRYLDLGSNTLQANDLHWLSGMTSLHHLDLSGWNLFNVPGWLHDINSALPSLRVLKLSNTQLQAGAIPHDSTTLLDHLNFTSLRVLDLSHNYDLNITLPQWLFHLTSLVHLDLSYCALYGKLPVTIGNLSCLRVLSLSGNSFDGVIPESLGNLTQLLHLGLSDNMITRLPQSIWELRNLQFLDVSGNIITGEIPETFANLTLLQHFDGSQGNSLSGKLPATMGSLVHLQFLDLSGNEINGEFPESIGNLSSLRELALPQNNINGTLPKGMGNLCKLQTLDFTGNLISGGIDDLIDGLSKCRENKDGSASESSEGLQTLLLGNNKLNGTVPENIGQLSKLSELQLFSNSLMGVLTESHFANLVNLTHLDLSYNSLRLNVSENWNPPFQCTFIRMCSCKLGPGFPTWVKTQTQLDDLCLSDAGISGNIPAWFWDQGSAHRYSLNLSNNNLEGRLPSSWKNNRFFLIDLSSNRFEGPLPELNPDLISFISLNDNSFSGSIPSYFAAATYIEIFSISDNHINGSIPPFFCNLTNLRLLDLSNNDMSGRLPHYWNPTSALQIIDLSDNNFIGNIPGGLFSCTDLRSLHLRNNGFSGDLPLSLKTAKDLVILDVGENILSGIIPTWIGENLSSLIVLRLRSNFFQGIIPEQLSKLSSLTILDLAHNNLSGCIPHSFGDFKAMVVSNRNESLSTIFDFSNSFSGNSNLASEPFKSTFAYWESLSITAKGLQREYSKLLSLVTSMDLSKNKLSCELPEEVTKLHGLHFLNLSGNLFNGRIPENIGDMKQLESLDLSQNNLSGTIPSGMSTLNFLGSLNLSHNNLSGKIPSGTQLQTFDPSAYNWNHDLCGLPLQNCANETHFSQGAKNEEGNEDWSEMLLLYIGLAMGLITGFWMIIGTIIIKQTIRIAYFRSIDNVYAWIYVKVVVYSRRLKSTFSRRN